MGRQVPERDDSIWARSRTDAPRSPDLAPQLAARRSAKPSPGLVVWRAVRHRWHLYVSIIAFLTLVVAFPSSQESVAHILAALGSAALLWVILYGASGIVRFLMNLAHRDTSSRP